MNRISQTDSSPTITRAKENPDKLALDGSAASSQPETDERQRAEDALRESQERLRSVVTGAPIIFFALDRNGVVTLSEGKGLESLGLQSGQLVGASVFDLYQDRPDILASCRRAIAGESFTATAEVGGTILETRWSPMLDAEGRVIGTIGVANDITDRKHAEDKLEQFRALIDQSNDAIYVIDPETSRYLDFNTQAHECLGYTREELAGLGVVNVALHVPDLKVWTHRVDLVLERGGMVFESMYRRKDGSIFPVEVSVRMPAHDKKSYMVAVVRDLTERKRVEKRLNASREAAMQFSRQLMTLQEVTNQLSKARSFDELCRDAVVLGRSRLGFDRSGIWFKDETQGVLIGSYGLDENGRLRDERDQRVPIKADDETWQALHLHNLVVRREDAPLYNDRHEQVGRGVTVTAALWDGDEVIGFISTDNLISKQPITEQQADILGLYASALGHLITRKRAEEMLDANRKAAILFSQHLMALQEVTNQLSKVASFDELCRQAVELGQNRLGFERSGIWFVDDARQMQTGSFGIDENGKLRDERDKRIPIPNDATWQALQRNNLIVRRDDVPLFNNRHEQVGRGTNVTAGLWDGDKIIGFISTDNLISKQPITEQQADILGLYASALGHLFTRKRAEEALRASEERYRALYRENPTMFFTLDSDAKVISVNDFGASQLGYTAEELEGDSVLKVFYEADIPAVVEQFKACVSNPGQAFHWEFRKIRKDGSMLWVEEFARAVTDPRGALNVLVVCQDITPRRQAEEALRESEALYRRAIESADTVPYYIEHPTNTYRFMGAGILSLTGYSEDEMTPKIWASLVQAKVLRGEAAGLKYEEALRRTQNGEIAVWQCDNRILTRDGQVRWIADSAVQVLNEQGKVAASMGILQDITERKKAEEALQEAEEKYHNIFDNIIEGIYQTTPQGQYIIANPALARMLGYDSPDDLISGVTDLNRQFYVQPDRRAEFKHLIEQFGTVTGFESEIYCKDGRTIWISENAHAVRDEHGTLLFYEGTTEDITARKRAEEALRQAEEQYRSIFENAIEGIYQTTPEGQILSVNPALARLLGYDSPADMIAGIVDIQHQYYVDPGQREIFSNLIMQKGEVHNLEYQALRKDGTPVWVSDNARAVYATDGGEPAHFEGFITDITERKQAGERIERQLRRLEALHAIDTAVSSSLDLHFTLNVLLEQVTRKLGIDAADVLLLNPDSYALEFAAGSGFRTAGFSRPYLELGQDHAGHAVLERQVVVVPNISQDDRLLQRGHTLSQEGFISYCGVPLVSKGKVKGVLEIFQRKPLEMDRELLDFLETLAGQTALAIDGAALFHDLEHSNIELTLAYDATIEGWSHALDLRDRETEGHTKRVTEMTLRLARALGMDEADLVHIRRGALLHDIGKMGIPDAILSKPGRLTKKEKELMRRHPSMAYEMLLPIAFLRPALDIPYCHHEKWDGSGYPQGLKGEEIPLEARIFAVVDVWDALRSDRPYRKRWTEKKVLQHLRNRAGRDFDPRIVEVFLSLQGS